MTHPRKGALARARVSFPAFFLMFLIILFVYHVHADELVISTSNVSYGLGATIEISGALTLQGNPVLNGLVAVQVQDSLKNVRFIRVVNTGISPNPWKVRIVKFVSCDLQGNPASSFRKGNLAYFEITVESLDAIERQVTVALDLFDPLGVSLSVQYSKFSLAPAKQFTILTSMPISSDAYIGQATCSASVLTDLPREDGFPYCAEQYVQFAITGEGPQVPSEDSALSAIGSNGLYSLSFKLSDAAAIGEYLVYARARYNAAGTTSFDYYWLYTDVNRDGVVNIVDISLVAKAFGSRAGDAKYRQLADINNDSKVNIVDIANVAKYFGRKMASA